MKSRQKVAAIKKHKVHFSKRRMYFIAIPLLLIVVVAVATLLLFQKQTNDMSCEQILSSQGVKNGKLSQKQQYELLKQHAQKCTTDKAAWQKGKIKDNQLIYATHYARAAQTLRYEREAVSIAEKAYDKYQEDVPYDDINDVPASVLNALDELKAIKDASSNV